MLYRPIEDTPWIDLAKVESPEIEEAAVLVERSERRLQALARLVDLGMELAEAAAQTAKTKLEALARDDAAPMPATDPTAAFSKIAQTVRRTIWLEARLAEDMKTRRAGLVAERDTRQVDFWKAQREVVNGVIDNAIIEALDQTAPDIDVDAAARLLADVREYLADSDEFRDYLDRPPGETIAKLCKTLGLDPDFCINDGDRWMTRREPYPFEPAQESSLPFPCGEGQSAKPSEWGAAGDPPAFDSAAPHSGCSASCPSP